MIHLLSDKDNEVRASLAKYIDKTFSLLQPHEKIIIIDKIMPLLENNTF